MPRTAQTPASGAGLTRESIVSRGWESRKGRVGLQGQLSHPETSSQRVLPSSAPPLSDKQPTKREKTARQKQIRLTAAEVTRLLDHRSRGATIVELAARFDIHRTTVMAHIKRNSDSEQSTRIVSPESCSSVDAPSEDLRWVESGAHRRTFTTRSAEDVEREVQ